MALSPSMPHWLEAYKSILLANCVSSAHIAVLRLDLLACSLLVMPSYWISALRFMSLAIFQMRQMPAGKLLQRFARLLLLARKLQAESCRSLQVSAASAAIQQPLVLFSGAYRTCVV